MITIIDYGSGNLHSIQKSIIRFYPNVITTNDSDLIQQANGIILPGVGAFGDAITELRENGLFNILKEKIQHVPTMGICLGMQLLFSHSQESAGIDGLNIIPGKVLQIERQWSEKIKTPHTGWNRLVPTSNPYFYGYVYFNHSYYCSPNDKRQVISHVIHGVSIPAIILKDQILGVQFHPEKSKKTGDELINYFVSLIKR